MKRAVWWEVEELLVSFGEWVDMGRIFESRRAALAFKGSTFKRRLVKVTREVVSPRRPGGKKK